MMMTGLVWWEGCSLVEVRRNGGHLKLAEAIIVVSLIAPIRYQPQGTEPRRA